MGSNMGLIIGIVVGVLVLIIILIGVMKIRKNKQDNQVTVLVNEEDQTNDKTNKEDVVELP